MYPITVYGYLALYHTEQAYTLRNGRSLLCATVIFMAAGTDPRRYMQIAAALRARIAAGELAPGDAMPSTRTLAQEYGTSLETANKALKVLADEGLIKRWPGLPYYVL